MKNNNGYYGWIHSLNGAAMQARQNGINMINEEKARKASASIQAKLAAQLDAPPPSPTVKPMASARANVGQHGQQILPIYDKGGKEVDRYTESQLTGMMASAIREKEQAKVPGYERLTAHAASLAGGDPTAFAQTKRMKIAANSAEMARARGPVDAKPAGDAQAVENDASDYEMADPDTALPTYSLAAQARAETEELEAAAKKREEEDYEEDESSRLWSGYSGRTGEVHEAISQKISKILKG